MEVESAVQTMAESALVSGWVRQQKCMWVKETEFYASYVMVSLANTSSLTCSKTLTF